jgi:hypothetical protein
VSEATYLYRSRQRDLARQRHLNFDVRAVFERLIQDEVDAVGTDIPGNSVDFAYFSSVLPPNNYRQLKVKAMRTTLFNVGQEIPFGGWNTDFIAAWLSAPCRLANSALLAVLAFLAVRALAINAASDFLS